MIIDSIAQARAYFKTQTEHYYFVSASNFNLMSIHSWVKNWVNVNLIDCYQGQNKSVLLPKYKTQPLFENIEQINEFLLGNKEVVEHIKQHKSATNVMFLFYNEALENLSKSLKMQKIMPKNALVQEIDNKITTTEIGNIANVPSVPNALVKIKSYQDLSKVQEKYNLSTNVVIQTAYGDSGKTTFFIDNEQDYQQYSKYIEAEDKVKVMQKIDCMQIAIEAVATKNGTFIGPILTEIIGNPDLTPYAGGWCGNDMGSGHFDEITQKHIYQQTQRLGDALYNRGYRGYFEVDYLLDKQNKNLYLGEINPRITGISALTNMSAFCQENMPLFLLHLLEFSQVEIKINAEDFNQKSQQFKHPEFGQLIFKYLLKDLKIVTKVPKTGVYQRSEDGQIEFVRYADDATDLKPNECYILQIIQKNDYVNSGTDLLVLFVGSALKTKEGELTQIAQSLIATINQKIQYRSLTVEEQQIVERYGKNAPLKTSEVSNNE
jgi:hypothetical protein